VVDEDRTLLGTFSDADLRRALTQNGEVGRAPRGRGLGRRGL